MRSKYLTKWLGALALLTAVTVHAQTSPAAPAAPAAKPARPLTLAEMKTQVGALEAQVAADATHVRQLQDLARKQKDVIKLSCVNDKLIEMKAQQNIFDDNLGGFAAAAEADSSGAQPAFTELGATAGAIHTVRQDADGCIGAPELYKQESDALVDHPDFQDDPTTTDPFAPETEAPGYASPFN